MYVIYFLLIFSIYISAVYFLSLPIKVKNVSSLHDTLNMFLSTNVL